MSSKTSGTGAGPLVGTSVRRLEDARLLSGHGRFLDDIDPIQGAAHAAIFRSHEAHARIASLDVTRAAGRPGVVGVLTGDDVRRISDPFPTAVDVAMDYYALAIDKVRYVGEPVAVVVARDRYIAEDAAALIEVAYEPLPRVLDPEQAAAGETLLHEGVPNNTGNHRTFSFGDPDAAFARAAVVIEERFEFPRTSSTPIECYAVVADWDEGDEMATVWSNFHGPFILHRVMARALRLQSHKLRLKIPPDIGGAFGIKSAVYPYIVLMTLASRAFATPVKWIEDRREHLMASSHGANRVAYVKGAFSAGGELLGLDYRFIDDVGAYIRSPEPATMYRCFGNFTGAYKVRDIRAAVMSVMTNKSPTGLNRGFGGPQLYFALEGTMDIAARRLGLDPIELRRRNLVGADQFPYRTPLGGLYDSGDYGACVERALRLSGYENLRRRQEEARAAGRLFGIGVATVVDPSGTNMGYVTLAQTHDERSKGRPMSGSTEVATVDMDMSGTAIVRLTTTPEGQGHETVAAQVVADELKIPIEQVTVNAEMDTLAQPWTITTGSYSSRFGPLGSSAIALAARKLRTKLAEVAGQLLEVDPHDLEHVPGGFQVRGSPTAISLRQIAGAVHWNAGGLPEDVEPGLNSSAYFSVPVTMPPNDRDQIDSSATYGFAVDIVAVEIDPETFGMTIVEYATVHDAGTLLNPMIVEGQIYGGAVHGLGQALFEEFVYDESSGQLLTTSFMDYLCPTAVESPDLLIDHIETPSPFSVLGSKGVGEVSTMSCPPAVANAVSDAIAPFAGPITRLPVTPTTLFDLVHARQSS